MKLAFPAALRRSVRSDQSSVFLRRSSGLFGSRNGRTRLSSTECSWILCARQFFEESRAVTECVFSWSVRSPELTNLYLSDESKIERMPTRLTLTFVLLSIKRRSFLSLSGVQLVGILELYCRRRVLKSLRDACMSEGDWLLQTAGDVCGGYLFRTRIFVFQRRSFQGMWSVVKRNPFFQLRESEIRRGCFFFHLGGSWERTLRVHLGWHDSFWTG